MLRCLLSTAEILIGLNFTSAVKHCFLNFFFIISYLQILLVKSIFELGLKTVKVLCGFSAVFLHVRNGIDSGVLHSLPDAIAAKKSSDCLVGPTKFSFWSDRGNFTCLMNPHFEFLGVLYTFPPMFVTVGALSTKGSGSSFDIFEWDLDLFPKHKVLTWLQSKLVNLTLAVTVL